MFNNPAATMVPADDPSLPALALQIEGLCKTYRAGEDGKAVEALRDVSLEVPRGGIFGLLGPNGAGKSTLINILAGMVIKSSGTVRIWGHDIETRMRQARASIGIVPQEVNLDAFFAPREVLEFQAGLYAVPKAERRTMELLDAMGLADKADAYARSLSGGMKRRLLIAKALVHSPPVVVLDEPTAGVDVELRRHLWSYMRELNRAGVTIVLTTHYLEEAEEMCDRIAIIDKGQVVACDDTPALVGRLDQRTMSVTVTDPLESLPDTLAAMGGVLDEDRRIIFKFSPSRITVGEILAAMTTAGITVVDLITEESDLEDIFIEITGLEDTAPAIAGAADREAGAAALARGKPLP